MGGVLARLMVSSSGDRLWPVVTGNDSGRQRRLARVRDKLTPYLQFGPVPQVSEAIFIASPHRGTPFAGNRLSRLLSNFIRLPAAIVTRFDDVAAAMAGTTSSARNVNLVPNGIDNLRDSDPFMQASSGLPISGGVRYHSIIARRSPAGPLEDTDDGLVPYWSSHLPGAASERVIVSGHSVQENPEAILEIRRILTGNVAAKAAAKP
jgi:hypothetical protein